MHARGGRHSQQQQAQQHSARYHRMEPAAAAAAADSAPSSAASGGRGRLSLLIGADDSSSAPRSPLLPPKSAVGSLADVLADVDDITEIITGDVETQLGESKSKKHSRSTNKTLQPAQGLRAFPSSLPSLVSSPVTDGDDDDDRNNDRIKSISAGATPAMRHSIAGVGDADGCESISASVYENCEDTITSATTGGSGEKKLGKILEKDNWYSASSGLHNDQGDLEGDDQDDCCPMPPPAKVGGNTSRKSGLGSGEGGWSRPAAAAAGGLVPIEQNTTNMSVRRSPSGGGARPRSMSRPSTPRCSLIESAAGAGGGGAGALIQQQQSSADQGAGTSTSGEEKDKKEIKGHDGPSSRRTVLVIAGLFVVGLILILSGIIVLSVEQHTAFRAAGCSFLGLGVTFFIICLVLQRKNVKKLVNELEKDLYFLNVTDNKIWNMIFHFDEQLHWS